MIERHEILFLHDKRVYVLVKGTWYDTHRDLNPQVDQDFLTGKIERVLTFEEYTDLYPESTKEIYSQVIDKTISGGFIRRVVNARDTEPLVKYAVNPAQPSIGSALREESLID